MTCDSVSNLISLYYYGELMPEEEDRLETHLAGCAACARELERPLAIAAMQVERAAANRPAQFHDLITTAPEQLGRVAIGRIREHLRHASGMDHHAGAADGSSRRFARRRRRRRHERRQ